ncbi:helix-turn-helix domain-containing protein [Spirosoma sp. HMF4905]|uniref:Helix-turn-helix domain-containing protein n=1 Tax=Spirosoma arboris TaxID=2682092 RepID=A0A7K1SEP8_9BACT|nr:helix-turn-helix domain-containing protein [Spirosoma arboris]MVM32287.1 helix-turn-helix domain-containing protein [Spirosoma arboris]
MKHVTIVVPQGNANLSSITGTYEILTGANAYWQRQGNRPKLAITVAGAVPEVKLDAGFITVHPTLIGTVKKTDLVIIPSAPFSLKLIGENKELIHWIKAQYLNGAEIASMCTGAFLLAATGLLDGKTCSTHWSAENRFKQMFPKINLQPDKLVTAEHGIYTNGGAYSFLHLVLFLVEIYFDRSTAIYCSKVFQIDMDRTSQSPFFIFQGQKNHGDEVVNKAQIYIEQNLRERISFEALAAELAISRRNFDRRFTKATGNTPVEYWQRVKIEVAKSALEKGRKSVYEVMTEVGYSDDKAFRDVFKKLTGVSPLDYRARYSKAF